jgi:hypothetical protein
VESRHAAKTNTDHSEFRTGNSEKKSVTNRAAIQS